MPSKYTIRSFIEGGIYHIFNRGVEKRVIFLDDQDYNIFLYYLFIYTADPKKVLNKYPELPLRLYNKNLHSQIEVLAYCLMPNHFHLLLKQRSINGVSKLLKQITNAYTLYFNQKYKRVGSLMQGRFRAVKIDNDDLLIHISRYIHLNPLVSNLTDNLKNYQQSSYLEYMNRKDGICMKNLILDYFSSLKGYEEFISDQKDYAQKIEKIKHMALD